LGVVDSRTVGEEDGMVNLAVYHDRPAPKEFDDLPDVKEGDERTLAAYVFPFKEGYKWHYFSGMSRAEVLAFKLHDSDHGRVWRTPHCAFKSGVPGAVERESIEIRTCCYFK
jgi:hypothetical protein